MNLEIAQSKPEQAVADILGVFLYEEKSLPVFLKNLDARLDDQLSNFLKAENFKGELNEIFLVPTFGKVPAKKILLLGLGKKEEFKPDNYRQAAATGAVFARASNSKSFSMYLHEHSGAKDIAQILAEGALIGLYEFKEFITDENEVEKKLERIDLFCGAGLSDVKAGAQTGQKLAESVNYARALANLPANIATPTYLANEAKKLSKLGIRVSVLGRAELKKLGMNALLGVSAGSAQEPKLVVLEYKKGKKTIALVGKGVTFDAGGLDIKPDKYMWNMHFDKCGALTVFGILHAAATLKLPVHLVGLVPLSENLLGGNAQKPADIVKSFSGKTIEIGNTDAEGRLIMADALAYAEKFKPNAILDFATLTGSCIAALGYHAAGLLGNNPNLIEKIKKASGKTAEKVWELPLWEEYKAQLKSEVADVKNIGKGGAGTITAAAFLEKFVPEKTNWAHFDIAGTAYVESESTPKPYASKGATGFGVRLVAQLLMDW